MYSQIWRRRDASSFGYNANNHVEFSLVTPPTVEPVSVTQLKQQARIPYPDSDEILALYISAARETIERYLRRALITQTWDFISDWGPAWVELPKPPTQTINAVFVTTLANNEITVPTSTYITNVATSFVGLNIGNVWPLHRGKAGFRVNFTAGYGATGTSVPATIKRCILALAAKMDQDRIDVDLPLSMEKALTPYRIMGMPFRMARGMAREDLLA